MTKFLYLLISFKCILSTIAVGQSYIFTLQSQLSNSVLKNNLARNLQSPVQNLLRCAAMCDRSCHCFGFNTHTNICRAFKTCDQDEVIGIEDGWIYFLRKNLGKINFSLQCTDLQAFKTLIRL